MPHSDARVLDHQRRARIAIRISLIVGVLMLAGKWAAYAITGSAAILSDATESVIHIIAVAFAAFSMRLSQKPANQRFGYGYERISFFSAGFEGAMIVAAAVSIIYAAVQKWRHGLQIDDLGSGLLITFGASVANALLGWYLMATGRKTNSMILEANGKHVLTDSWTSFGVVGGLLLVLWTGWKPFDPLLAIAVAVNILWSGFVLIRASVGGLMDYADPRLAAELRRHMDELCREQNVHYHALRFRDTGVRLIVEAHLLFPYGTRLGDAHQAATRLEEGLPQRLGRDVELITHLEALEDHGQVHAKGHSA